MVLPEYYLRQSAEQYFDYGKNYAKFLPIRQHSMDTLAGHLLLAFIASFLIVLVKNRLNILDVHYVAVPPRLICKDGEQGADEEQIIVQDPLNEIFSESPSTLFRELRGQKADVFQGCLVPSCTVKKANDFYDAFALKSPLQIHRKGEKLTFEFEKEGNKLNKIIVFTQRPCITDEEIEKKRTKEQKKVEAEHEIKEKVHEERRKRGRPLGSKNKTKLEDKTVKVINSECTEEHQETRRKRGRPIGAKNKKKNNNELHNTNTDNLNA